MIKREHDKKQRQKDRELARASRMDADQISDIQRALQALPELPQNATVRAFAMAQRLPEWLRARALKIVATKLASDFALRFLLLLEGAVPQGKAHADELNVTDAQAQRVITELIETWAQLPASIRVQTLQDFGNFARITSGLQMMLEAALPEGRDAWVFDAGSQYCSALFRMQLLPHATLNAHRLSGNSAAEHAYEVQIARFDDRGSRSMPSRGSWPRPSIAQEATRPVRARLFVESGAPSGSDMALTAV